MVATTQAERAALAVPVVLDPTHHLSRLAAGRFRSPAGAAVLQALRQNLQGDALVNSVSGKIRRSAPEHLANLFCWRDTPELYRKLICRAAGVPLEVADKRDRDLSEREKVMLRAAVRDLREYCAGLGAL